MEKNRETKKILVVEDEFITASALTISLEGMGFKVVGTADRGEDAIKKVCEFRPDAVLMDIILAGEMNGITAGNIIRQKYDIPVIYLTGQSDDLTIAHALESEPFGYIIKPFEERNLKTTIQMALYKHSIDRNLRISEKRYRALAESAEDLIFLINRDLSIAYINGATARFLNSDQNIVVGKGFREIFPEDFADQVLSPVEEVFSSGTHQHVILNCNIKEHDIWLDTTIIPLITEEIEVVQIFGISHDITLQVLLQKEMEKKGIVQIEKNMEQFQILNDRIRNPLAVIVSAASLVEGEMSKTIINQANLIDDLVSQLDQGWIESEKIRSFLLRHYQHGKELS